MVSLFHLRTYFHIVRNQRQLSEQSAWPKIQNSVSHLVSYSCYLIKCMSDYESCVNFKRNMKSSTPASLRPLPRDNGEHVFENSFWSCTSDRLMFRHKFYVEIILQMFMDILLLVLNNRADLTTFV